MGIRAMSVHGLCHDNGMSGRCGPECELFIMGKCDIGAEICEMAMEEMPREDLQTEIELNIEPVRLFVLRGKGTSDLNLLCEAWGYK